MLWTDHSNSGRRNAINSRFCENADTTSEARRVRPPTAVSLMWYVGRKKLFENPTFDSHLPMLPTLTASPVRLAAHRTGDVCRRQYRASRERRTDMRSGGQSVLSSTTSQFRAGHCPNTVRWKFEGPSLEACGTDVVPSHVFENYRTARAVL